MNSKRRRTQPLLLFDKMCIIFGIRRFDISSPSRHYHYSSCCYCELALLYLNSFFFFSSLFPCRRLCTFSTFIVLLLVLLLFIMIIIIVVDFILFYSPSPSYLHVRCLLLSNVVFIMQILPYHSAFDRVLLLPYLLSN